MQPYRLVFLGCSALALVACASSSPLSYAATTPAPIEGTFACALRKVNEIGYTVTNTNKEAGFITAEKQTSTGVGEFFSGQKKHDVLTVAIFDDANDSRKIRVTVAQSTEKAMGLFGNASKTGLAPSETGKSDANSILTACSNGDIKSAALPFRFESEAGVGE